MPDQPLQNAYLSPWGGHQARSLQLVPGMPSRIAEIAPQDPPTKIAINNPTPQQVSMILQLVKKIIPINGPRPGMAPIITPRTVRSEPGELL